jgi:rhodanese-related sulfurtransferase
MDLIQILDKPQLALDCGHLTQVLEDGMKVAEICAGALCLLIFGWIVIRRLRAKRYLEANSIEPEALQELLSSKQVKLYDVRQPLDFLAHPEIIPGAMRIAPKDIAERTASFSRDQNSVIYCTGADDETSKMVLGKARALDFTQIKLLRGGLAAWKAKGYPVEPYTTAFQLDTAT